MRSSINTCVLILAMWALFTLHSIESIAPTAPPKSLGTHTFNVYPSDKYKTWRLLNADNTSFIGHDVKNSVTNSSGIGSFLRLEDSGNNSKPLIRYQQINSLCAVLLGPSSARASDDLIEGFFQFADLSNRAQGWKSSLFPEIEPVNFNADEVALGYSRLDTHQSIAFNQEVKDCCTFLADCGGFFLAEREKVTIGLTSVSRTAANKSIETSPDDIDDRFIAQKLLGLSVAKRSKFISLWAHALLIKTPSFEPLKLDSAHVDFQPGHVTCTDDHKPVKVRAKFEGFPHVKYLEAEPLYLSAKSTTIGDGYRDIELTIDDCTHLSGIQTKTIFWSYNYAIKNNYGSVSDKKGILMSQLVIQHPSPTIFPLPKTKSSPSLELDLRTATSTSVPCTLEFSNWAELKKFHPAIHSVSTENLPFLVNKISVWNEGVATAELTFSQQEVCKSDASRSAQINVLITLTRIRAGTGTKVIPDTSALNVPFYYNINVLCP